MGRARDTGELTVTPVRQRADRALCAAVPPARPTLEVLYADAQLLAVAKPAGLLVHAGPRARERDTCIARLRRQLGQRVWPVHRLDRGTSGVLLFALDAATARRTMALFARRQVDKTYLALTRGWTPADGAIDRPLRSSDGGPPRAARTRYTRLATVELPCPVGRYASARYSLVLVQPLSGREHQVRRHLRHINHPVVGDVTHGDGRHNRFFRERFGVRRLWLHAAALRLPADGERPALDLAAGLPPELANVFSELGWSEALRGALGALPAAPDTAAPPAP